MSAAPGAPGSQSRFPRILQGIERAFLFADGMIERLLPARLNPLAHTGAIATAAFLIAAVTGVLLLPWYKVSAEGAYASVEAMARSPWTAGLLRSLHRFSSDASILFAALHALRLLGARRFGGARAMAWITGIALVAVLWFVGWLGYWLVWDQRAQLVAVGTAKLLDGLPIFAEPLSRSFLTNEGLSSLLFFMVFFFHMLIPLAMGILLWLHINHLSRARFLPSRGIFGWLVGVLVAISLVEPARSALAADLLAPVSALTIDVFYLWPLLLTDRLGGWQLWTIAAALVGGLASLPLWLSKGRAQAAEVDTARCNGCTHCYQDCPYDAIRMVPRTDGRGYELQAQVDPSRCVGCGICAGSCDSAGIALPQLPVLDERRRIEGWLEEAAAAGERTHLAFVCASSAGSALRIDPQAATSEHLPGYRILEVPCVGWVQRFTLERALRRGAGGALLVGCGPTEPHFREGTDWTAQRLSGEREPSLRREKVEGERIHFHSFDRTKPGELKVLAAQLVSATGRDTEEGHGGEGAEPVEGGARQGGAKLPLRLGAGLVAIGAVFALGIALLADSPYRPPLPTSQLVVSFKHPGQLIEDCRDLTESEIEKLPPHMRRETICERGRAAVRLRVTVDGALALEQRYEPRGLRGDGNSVALERLELAPGLRQVEVAIGDGAPDTWSHVERRSVHVHEGSRAVVLFDRVGGFRWHVAVEHPPPSEEQAVNL